MELILVRHGNTFAAGEKVVRAGLTTDYPLVATGRKQAECFAGYLSVRNIVPKTLYTGSLLRTSEFAAIVSKTLHLTRDRIVTDARLNELDYGAWSGLSDEEIVARFGENELADWNDLSRWPKSGVFGGSEDEAIEDALSFLNDLIRCYEEGDVIVAVSSNGKLRYFLKAIGEEFDERQKEGKLKVKTGHFCRLHYQENTWKLGEWNTDPS